MFRKKFLTLFFLPMALFLWSSVFPVQAQAQTQAWKGVCVASEDETNPAFQVATIQGLQCVIGNILSIATTFIGLAGFILLIVGAFRYLISGGNSKGVEDAKKTLTFAFAGLVVAISAVIILNLIARFTGVNSILNFTIPNSQTQF